MSIILKVWDIHEHNARIINYSLTKIYFKRFFIRYQQLSFQIDFGHYFTDSIKLKRIIKE